MQHLTEISVLFVMIMFNDPSIRKEVIDDKESNLYSKITVDTETGDIVLGKTRFVWWNQLIGAEKRISLPEFVFKVIGALSSKAEEDGRGQMVSAGLLKDLSDLLNREGRSNDVINRLFLVGYIGVKTAWSCPNMEAEGFASNNKPTEVKLHVNEEVRTFELPGSGDPILRVKIGPTGVQYLGEDQSGDQTQDEQLCRKEEYSGEYELKYVKLFNTLAI